MFRVTGTWGKNTRKVSGRSLVRSFSAAGTNERVRDDRTKLRKIEPDDTDRKCDLSALNVGIKEKPRSPVRSIYH